MNKLIHLEDDKYIQEADFVEEIFSVCYNNSKKIVRDNMCIYEYDCGDTFIVFIVAKNSDKALKIDNVLHYTIIENYLYISVKNDNTLLIIDVDNKIVKHEYKNTLMYENINDKSILISTDNKLMLINAKDLNVLLNIDRKFDKSFLNHYLNNRYRQYTFEKAHGVDLTLFKDLDDNTHLLINPRSGKCIKCFNDLVTYSNGKNQMADIWVKTENEQYFIVGVDIYSFNEFIERFKIMILDKFSKIDNYGKETEFIGIKTPRGYKGTISCTDGNIRINNRNIKSKAYSDIRDYFGNV